MKKKIALVTGASGGIGGACAEKLAREGYTVLVHGCRGLRQAEALADRLCAEGHDAHAVFCDLADSESVQAMCRDVLETVTIAPSFRETMPGASARMR